MDTALLAAEWSAVRRGWDTCDGMGSDAVSRGGMGSDPVLLIRSAE